MRRRTKARETAMQFLYQVDLRGETVWSEVEDFLDHASKDGVLPDADAKEFARRLILGTKRHREEIDALLKSVARNWDLRRMAAVDRNILRMSAYEMLWCKDVPPKVAINEAIELGKRFSTANSGAFVNGILDRIRIDKLGNSDKKLDDRPASIPAPADAAAPAEAGNESAGQ
ncbi:MAG: transcription antitermination factor NusB [Planctomycetes bacterium]|nr:transcription antitermination factor NusB [Planctomycetota bacterium]